MDRKIGDIPSYVTGPASRACGGCHRAVPIKEDNVVELLTFNQHVQQGGYLIEAGDDPVAMLMNSIDNIMAFFK